MLLWHGSRLSNWTGILSQGLRIPPPEAPATRYMFGKGVYFADMAWKSADHITAQCADPFGVLLLAEVALGDMNELQKEDFNAINLPNGKLRTKAVGGTSPNPEEHQTLEDEVVVPVGDPTEVHWSLWDTLEDNEYVVYNPAQIRMGYLVHVRFIHED